MKTVSFFPSRTVAIYMGRMFLLRTFAVLAALVLVLREERELPQARARWATFRMPSRHHPVRGLVLVVDNLDAAQRAFQPWGLLARMTPQAVEWLAPRSKTTSPGPDPVYGS